MQRDRRLVSGNGSADIAGLSQGNTEIEIQQRMAGKVFQTMIVCIDGLRDTAVAEIGIAQMDMAIDHIRRELHGTTECLDRSFDIATQAFDLPQSEPGIRTAGRLFDEVFQQGLCRLDLSLRDQSIGRRQWLAVIHTGLLQQCLAY